jgi:hypothetical protein
MDDLQARIDQAEMSTRETARPLAAFYAQLVEKEVPEMAATQLTLIYARKILKTQ